MIAYRFFLDDLQIDEPQGFAEIVINMTRDDNWHGVFFEASTSDLRFYREGAEYLIEKKETMGLRSEVIFKAEAMCDGELDYTTILQGKLNFGRYKKICGQTCYVSINVEQENCTMTLRNRYDQKVEVEATTAFDKVSALAPYDKIEFDLSLPAKDLFVGTQGDVELGGYTFNFDTLPTHYALYSIRPVYSRIRNESLIRSQLIPFGEYGSDVDTIGPTFQGGMLSPVLLFDDNADCFTGDFDVRIRLKGSYNIESFNRPIEAVKLLIIQTSDPSIVAPDRITHMDVDLPFSGDDAVGTFDEIFDDTITIAPGMGIYAYFRFETSPGVLTTGTIDWDEETSVDITTNKACPPTTAKVSAVNETLSRVSEAITNNCMKVKSDYYGRTDSEPYTSLVDGCGSLRVLTSGLELRKDANARFFASMKELFEGLKAIDNIGMGIEPNPNIAGFDWLRIENIEYFYQDNEILRLPYVPNAEISVDESKHYSLIKVGYKKWEVENVNGLDEPNSNKEYRTSLSSINNTLDITSNLISGSYAIEITRQQSFAASGGADTKYDNDIFIICVDRGAYGFSVEQGNITAGPYSSGLNVYSPQTLYNWRIRPYYNLMRWFKSIINSYANLVDPPHKLFFASGTGNFLAEGELIDGVYDATGCKLENGAKAENDDLGLIDFLNASEGTPLWRPEIISVKEYPLSIKDYKALKAQPYGYIAVQCGTGAILKGFVKSVEYKPTQGKADFILKAKWQ